MGAPGLDLIHKAVAGDEAALTELIEASHDSLRARLDAKIGRHYRSAFSADDVLQVTYLEAFMRIGQFEPDGEASFGKWLFMIAEHNALDSIRELNRKKRPPRHRQVTDKPTDDSYVTLLAMLPGSQTPPSQRVSRREIRALIEDAIEQLPPDYARVVRGCDLEGRGTAEMAEEMGRSSGAIHMLRARAHDWLAEILGESTQFFGKSA